MIYGRYPPEITRRFLTEQRWWRRGVCSGFGSILMARRPRWRTSARKWLGRNHCCSQFSTQQPLRQV